MAGKKLARYVTVGSVTYGPDDDVPAEVAEQITNEKAWVSDEDAAKAEADGAKKAEAGTSSGDRLAVHVTVGAVTYGPDDAIPDEVAAQITNPKAWKGGKLPTAAKAEAADTTDDKDDADDKSATPAKSQRSRR